MQCRPCKCHPLLVSLTSNHRIAKPVMTIALSEINQHQLTDPEKESILNHAIDLHLLGSDEADHAGFDIIEARADVKYMFRLTQDGEKVGVMYILPFKNLPDHYEMTILIHDEHRGKHITADAVSQVEATLKRLLGGKATLCATVREHNPMRQELTNFLLKHGYIYNTHHMAFMKTLLPG